MTKYVKTNIHKKKREKKSTINTYRYKDTYIHMERNPIETQNQITQYLKIYERFQKIQTKHYGTKNSKNKSI